jgi:hypothetical protein
MFKLCWGQHLGFKCHYKVHTVYLPHSRLFDAVFQHTSQQRHSVPFRHGLHLYISFQFTLNVSYLSPLLHCFNVHPELISFTLLQYLWDENIYVHLCFIYSLQKYSLSSIHGTSWACYCTVFTSFPTCYNGTGHIYVSHNSGVTWRRSLEVPQYASVWPQQNRSKLWSNLLLMNAAAQIKQLGPHPIQMKALV